MTIINTEVNKIYVEIEGNEYELAERTVGIEEKILSAVNACIGKPRYMVWLAELEVLLGKSVVKKLFTSGKNENLDRLYRIHSGVVMAFEKDRLDTDAMIASERADNVDLSNITEPVDKLNKLFDHVDKLTQAPTDDRKVIRRG